MMQPEPTNKKLARDVYTHRSDLFASFTSLAPYHALNQIIGNGYTTVLSKTRTKMHDHQQGIRNYMNFRTGRSNQHLPA